jgi:Uma2 family endonuclease
MTPILHSDPSATHHSPPIVFAESLLRLSVDQYHAMIDAGIFSDDERVELLEGWLVQKMTKNPPHRIATRLVRVRLDRIVPTGWYVEAQDPITLETSEPEPDVSVIRGDTQDYSDRHPGPGDVAIVVEVADTSIEQDRVLKKRVYARESIPVYWIVDLTTNQIEVYSDPSGPAVDPDYGRRAIYTAADELPVTVGGREVGRLAVRDLLPKVGISPAPGGDVR